MSSALDELQREVGRLKNDLAALQTESRANQGVLAGAVRKTRKQLVEIEQHKAVARLAQPTSLINWTPRGGDAAHPALDNSLIDRLRRGQPVADTLGGTEPITGQANLLDDSAFDGIAQGSLALGGLATIGYTPTEAGNTFPGVAWQAQKITSGTANCTIVQGKPRASQEEDPFNSARVDLQIDPTSAGTHEIRVEHPFTFSLATLPKLSYLVGAVRVARLFAQTLTNITSRTLTVELYDATDAVVRATTTLDLVALSDSVLQALGVTAALNLSSLTLAQQDHPYRVRFRLVVVSTGAGGSVKYSIGEPELHLGYSPDALAFAPLISGWAPQAVMRVNAAVATDLVVSSKLFGDTTAFRFVAQAGGQLEWGSGAAARDLSLSRGSARRLVVRALTGAALTLDVEAPTGGTNEIGLYDAADTKDRLQLEGDSFFAGLQWSAGVAPYYLRLYRNAAGTLKIDGNGQANLTNVTIESTAGQAAILGLHVAGDAQERLFLRGDATEVGFELGGGGTRDLRIYRNAAAQTVIDANGQAVGTNVEVRSTAGQRNSLRLIVDGDTVYRVWAEGSATLTGILFSTGAATADLQVRRIVAGGLQVDANGQANSSRVIHPSTAAQRAYYDAAVAGDTVERLLMSGDATLTGFTFSSGAATPDLRAYRNAASSLTFDSNGAAGSTAVQIVSTAGQRNFLQVLVSGDTNARTFIEGSATVAGISHGPGNAALDTRYYRSAAKAILFDDNAGGGILVDFNLGDMRLPVGTAAIPATEGDIRWRTASNVTGGLLSLYDSQRERAISAVGWQAFAFPQGAAQTDALATALVLPINGGSVAIPFELSGHMLLQQVTYRCTAASGTSEWRIYKERLNNGNAGENTLDEVPGANGTGGAQGAAANINSATATAPTYLAPGAYWIVLRCTSGATTFSLASTASGALAYGICQTKTLAAGLGATLDFVAAAWVKNSSTTGVRIIGRVFGQTTAF